MSESENSNPETQGASTPVKAPQTDALARTYLQTLLDLHKKKYEGDQSEISFTPRLSREGSGPSERFPIRPDIALLTVLVARQVEKHPGLADRLKKGGPILTIKCRDEKEIEHIETVLEKCVVGLTATPRLFRGYIKDDKEFLLISNERKSFREAMSRDLSIAFAKGMTVIGLATDPQELLPNLLCEASECQLDLEAPDASAIKLALQYVTGEHKIPDVAEGIAKNLSPLDLIAAVRPGRPIADAIAHLGRLVAGRETEGGAIVLPNGPRLEDLHGYGMAKSWGLDALKDMQSYSSGDISWQDVDHRGLLLSGPPGVGKTMFARALANSYGLPLIATSVADWNAHPYMSGTLASIRNVFAEARKKKPAVLFIDELDGISSRADITGEWAQYWTQVVNLLLEEMQGTTSNEGVLLIAATNFADKIDPAILRAGRLDHHIRLGLPDITDLKAIYRYCLGASQIDDDALSRLAAASIGNTGADIDAYVRRAKGLARREQAELTESHVLAQINPGNAGLEAKTLRHLAVHEAGHAVAHYLAGAGKFDHVALSKTGGHLYISTALTQHSGKADLEKLILCLLAGSVAEQIVFGDATVNYAIGEGNDLTHATGLSIKIELTFEEPIGYSGDINRSLECVPGLLAKVKARLANAAKECRRLLSAELDLLQAVSDALEHSHYIDRQTFEALCDQFGHAGKARHLTEVA